MHSVFPARIRALVALYFLATLAHFAHNAEFIAFYPNMPPSLTRETVYLAWLAITAIGVAALIAARFGLPVLGALLLGAYGAMGLDGLGHYMLALCSEHTLATNLTIGFEVTTGVVLLLTSAVLATRLLQGPRTLRQAL